MEMIKTSSLFLIGFLIVIFSGNLFVDASVRIAKISGLPEIAIGATVVSLGTTMPEIMVSSMASIAGSGDIALGNAIGSIICNTGLICGLSLFFTPGKVPTKPFNWRVVYFFFSFACLFFFASRGLGITRFDGGLLLLLLLVYTVLCMKIKDSPGSEPSAGGGSGFTPNLLKLLLSAVLLFIGARLLVDSAVSLAHYARVPERVIGVTVVALGTSLPELVTALVAISKKHGNISLGNIIGANMLNVLSVCGIASVISPILPTTSSLLYDFPVAALVMVFLTLPIMLFRRTFRIQGVILLLCYVVYCAHVLF